jgi:hypothetical protein
MSANESWRGVRANDRGVNRGGTYAWGGLGGLTEGEVHSLGLSFCS